MQEAVEEKLTYQKAVKTEKNKIFFKEAKILLVEDNEMNQELTVSLLNSVGLATMVAANGQIALDLLKKNAFDLVLMDIQMPVMNGLDATKAIRSRSDEYFKKVPIVAMSARAFQKDRDDCINAGMNSYIAKPIDPMLLYDVLAQYLPVADSMLIKGRGTQFDPDVVDAFLAIADQLPEIYEQFKDTSSSEECKD